MTSWVAARAARSPEGLEQVAFNPVRDFRKFFLDVLQKVRGGAVRLQGGVVDMSSLQLMDMIRIVHQDKIALPGYTGSMNFRFAHPTE